MSSRTRRNPSPLPLSPMKATFTFGSVGIGPNAPCACPCAGTRARARRVARILPTLLALALVPAHGHAQGALGPIPTDPNVKVAFIGDSGSGDGFRRVLELIKSERADLVLHQGDFDYAENARGFFQTIDSVLGRDFPYFASVGNHDTDNWRENCWDRDGCYARFLKARMARLGVTPDDPDLDDQMYSVTYRGLRLVFVGEGGVRAGDRVYAPYIQRQLATDGHIWK